jgi:hypothetical protein
MWSTACADLDTDTGAATAVNQVPKRSPDKVDIIKTDQRQAAVYRSASQTTLILQG